MAKWSKVPNSSSGLRQRAWVQIPLLTYGKIIFCKIIYFDFNLKPIFIILSYVHFPNYKKMAEWSKAPDSSSGLRERAWVQIPLLTFEKLIFRWPSGLRCQR
ncbi:hypothetical protein HN51_061455, partial [Arachis hypogaea]